MTDTSSRHNIDPSEQDAERSCLIAAAPDLLAALLIAKSWLVAAEQAGKIGGEEFNSDMSIIWLALAKARGDAKIP